MTCDDAHMQLRAITAQIDAIVGYALLHEAQRLFIRGKLRDALAVLERHEPRETIRWAPPGGAK